jgi:uncharacterized protein (DUF2384 family)
MATALANEAIRIRDAGKLNDSLIAAGTGASTSTVRGWIKTRSQPTGERAQRLIELSEMIDRLRRVMDPDYIPIWLSRPLEALDDDRPIDVLGRGEYRRVAQVIAALEDPGVS